MKQIQKKISDFWNSLNEFSREHPIFVFFVVIITVILILIFFIARLKQSEERKSNLKIIRKEKDNYNINDSRTWGT